MSDLSHLTSTGELTSQSTVDHILHENQPKTRLQYLLLIDRRLDSLYPSNLQAIPAERFAIALYQFLTLLSLVA